MAAARRSGSGRGNRVAPQPGVTGASALSARAVTSTTSEFQQEPQTVQALFNLAGNVAAVTDGGGVHASKMALRLARGNRRRHPDGNKTAAEKRTAEVDSTGRRRLAGRVDASQQGIRRLPLRRSREPSRACASSSRRRAPTAGRRFLKSPANNGSPSSPSKVFSCTAAEASLIQIARFLARKWRRSASGATPSVRSSSRPGKTGSCSRKSRWPASCGTPRWAGSESPASSPRCGAVPGLGQGVQLCHRHAVTGGWRLLAIIAQKVGGTTQRKFCAWEKFRWPVRKICVECLPRLSRVMSSATITGKQV